MTISTLEWKYLCLSGWKKLWSCKLKLSLPLPTSGADTERTPHPLPYFCTSPIRLLHLPMLPSTNFRLNSLFIFNIKEKGVSLFTESSSPWTPAYILSLSEKASAFFILNYLNRNICFEVSLLCHNQCNEKHMPDYVSLLSSERPLKIQRGR